MNQLTGGRYSGVQVSSGYPLMTAWNASIEETKERDGTFRATLHEQPIEIVSRDPEHDLCHAIVNAGLADGPIQFWSGATPSLRYRSVHTTAAKRIELGEKFPYKRRPRREDPVEEFKNPGPGVNAGGQTGAARYQTAKDEQGGCEREASHSGEGARSDSGSAAQLASVLRRHALTGAAVGTAQSAMQPSARVN